VYTLFSNRVRHKDGVNHWIPFDETEVGAPERFSSHVVRELITKSGALVPDTRDASSIFGEVDAREDDGWSPLSTLSVEADAVLMAGRKIWSYYLSCPDVDVNASFYDISAFFQGTKSNGDLSGRSDDAVYEPLRKELGLAKRVLERKIAPKVFEYGFLMK